MLKIQDVVNYFKNFVPYEMKMDFDNVGLLVGRHDNVLEKVLISLDITDEVIDEAIKNSCQLILSHHPLFFSVKDINDESVNGRRILKLIENGISCLCLHTNLDCVKGGVNDVLAQKLGLSISGWLDDVNTLPDGTEYGLGRYGYLDKAETLEEFLTKVKETLGVNAIRYYGENDCIKKVAVCGGSGGDMVKTAYRHHCDTLVTADVKYHQMMDAKDLGINIIDADHFCTENIIVPVLADMLNLGFPQLEVIVSEVHGQTAKIF